MPPLHFQPASAASLADLVEAVNRGYEGYVGEFSAEDTASYAQFIREQQLDLELSIIVRAPDGLPDGVAVVGRRGDEGWIGDFAVVPRGRGTLLARTLLDAALGNARSAGIRRMWLDVAENNHAARRLYSRAGFAQTRLLHNFSTPLRNLRGKSSPHHAVPAIELACWLPDDPIRPSWDHDLPSMLVASGTRTLLEEQGRVLLHYHQRDDEIDILYLGLRDGATAETAHGLLAALTGPPSTIVRASYVPDESPLLELLPALGFTHDNFDIEMGLEL